MRGGASEAIALVRRIAPGHHDAAGMDDAPDAVALCGFKDVVSSLHVHVKTELIEGVIFNFALQPRGDREMYHRVDPVHDAKHVVEPRHVGRYKTCFVAKGMHVGKAQLV